MISEVKTHIVALDRNKLCEAIQQVFTFWREAHDRQEQGEHGAWVTTRLWGQIHAVCAETFLHGTDAEIKAITDFLHRLNLQRDAPCPEQSEASK